MSVKPDGLIDYAYWGPQPNHWTAMLWFAGIGLWLGFIVQPAVIAWRLIRGDPDGS